MMSSEDVMAARVWRMVVVDDSPEDRAEARRLLLKGSDRRYMFVEAETGAAAVRAVLDAPGGPPDCVLLDYNLPDMDAEAVLAAIGGRTGLPACPIVVLTGSDGAERGRAVLRAGAQDYIGKDWLTPYALTRAVENAAERWAMLRELRAGEAALRARTMELESLLTSAPLGVAFFDRGHRYVRINDTLAAINGLPAAEHIGRAIEELLPVNARAVVPVIDRVFASGRAVDDFEVAGETPREPGVLRHWLTGFYPVRNEGGEVETVGVWVIEITERKRAEAALAARERELRALADNSPDILTRFDRELRHVFVNAAVEKATGRSPAEFLGKTNRELGMPVELCDLWEATVRHVFEARQHRSIDFAFDGPTGPRLYTSRLVPELDPAGKVEFVLGVTHDVTDRRRAEDALRVSEEQSRRQLQELDTLYQTSPVGMWLGDRECRFLRVNEVLARINGYPIAAHLGRSVRELVPAVADIIEPYYRQVIETKQPASNFEVIGRTPGVPGGDRTWVASYYPLLGADGEVAAVGGLMVDVTERKAFEQALRDADRHKDEFLATLAHELRNPLAPIRTGLQVMKLSPGDGPAVASARATMERQLGHMVRLIDDLLDVSRVSRGKIELKRARVPLQVVLEHALEASRSLIDAGRHALAVQAPDEPVWVDGDLTRLSQVVSNLLNNAAKYTPDGGRIELWAGGEGGEAVVRVADNGVGISADMLPKVFDLFAQVDRTRERAQGGLGIGLALAQKLVEMHGGAITAESPGLGRGSTFTVRLPHAADAERDGGAPPEAARPASAWRRVLVVDDNVDAAEMLAMLLELEGHSTTTAHDGREALAVARAFRPEIVFLDIGLPGMSGYEVAQALRREPGLAGAMLVALTGWGSEDDKRKSREAGFDVHLTKPIEPDAIADVIAQFSSLSRPRSTSAN